MTTQSERLARVEERLDRLEDEVKGMREDIKELLALKNRGMGAFWFASLIAGSGLLSLAWAVISWFKGN